MRHAQHAIPAATREGGGGEDLDPVRAFVALELPEPVRQGLAAVTREIGREFRSLRPTPPGNVHLTLRFLGDVPRTDLRWIEGEIERSLGGLGGFGFDVEGLGVFPDLHRPRVLWAGVKDPSPLVTTAERVFQATRDVASADGRPFRAHATVGRFRDTISVRGLGEALRPFAARSFGRAETAEVVLYQSLPGSSAPRYRPLARFRLGGAPCAP